ncbi:protein-disulfide reductase DsbD family protein [Teichococcus vastitatis]|uniref:Thioredoxin family protein n=1 Tax=Teichococcus vastitatis TaxID=2307076 RepID=A0ABS9W3T6_9PROT|nr:protein-disulfide reductase DsbD domain-containing protein [Pseudoroseomonas vastitatis]MCI0753887.1 thioredoxin family protein [Pseudoroseomonas vastitatis]
MPRLLPVALAALAVLAPALPLAALESAAVRTERASMTLVTDAAAIAPGQSLRLGLQQKLEPGWHTYWRNPGDAGAPPEIRFTAPAGLQAGEFEWPAPRALPFGPLMNYGYENAVLLPFRVTAPAGLRPGDSLILEATATWLICKDICVPEEGHFRLDLPVRAAPRPDPVLSQAFRAADAVRPRPAPWEAQIGFDGETGALRLDSPDFSPATLQDAQFFPHDPGLIDHASPQMPQIQQGTVRLNLKRGMAPMPHGPAAGVLVLTDGAGTRSAYDIAPEPGAVPPPLAGEMDALPLWKALLLAALGGLVLNLMPCVFPILAMKAMALARLSGVARGAVRGHAASYTLGVVLSFLALGGIMVGLRMAGMAVGWGFQFTAPVFVAGMAWLMLAVGLNLSGVFRVGGPVGAGSSLVAQGGHAGSLATGALAVLVATPCTAPFMAAAIGSAMVLPYLEGLGIFIALGIGMAAPYALLGIWPDLAKLLPRPGAWMEVLRQILAFPMYGAALWLFWVLAQQVAPVGLGLALVGALGIGFTGWAVGWVQRAQRPVGRRLGWLGAAAGLALALGALTMLPATPAARAGAPSMAGAEAWSEQRLAELRAEKRPVFVNMTAAWCITCKVNERVALRREAVLAAFAQRNIAVLEGDWTDGGPEIAAALRSFGREGVPLYLLYPAGGGEAEVLPQILTEGVLLRALEAAAPLR